MKIMIKKIIVILSIVLTICLCSCQSNSNNTNKSISRIIDTNEVILLRDENNFSIQLNSEEILKEYNIDISTYTKVNVTLKCNDEILYNDVQPISSSSTESSFDYSSETITTEKEDFNNKKDSFSIELKFAENQVIRLQE